MIHSSLKNIPFNLKLVKYFIPKIGSVYNALKLLGVEHLDDIYCISEDAFVSINGMTAAKWNRVLELKNILETRHTEVTEYFRLCVKRTEYPILDENEDGLTLDKEASIVLEQLAEHIKSAAAFDKQYAKLHKYFEGFIIKDLSSADLKNTLKVDTEGLRQAKIRFFKQLTDGKFDKIDNLAISDDFMCKLRATQAKLYAFSSLKTLYTAVGCDDFETSSIRFFMNLQRAFRSGAQYNYFDQAYFIPKEFKLSDIRNYINAITKLLAFDKDADIRPLPFGRIMEGLTEKFPNYEFDPVLVEAILTQHTWIITSKTENGIDGFMMSYNHLNKYQKIARLIYEFKHISREELLKVREERDGGKDKKDPNIHTIIEKYPWVSLAGRNGVYEYNPDCIVRKYLADEIKDYAESKRIFKYHELVEHLEELGFVELNGGTLRTYIMRSCQCSIDDNNLFCHSSFLNLYDNIRWRAKTQHGLFHWILNVAILYLKNCRGYKSTKKKVIAELKANNPENYILKNDLWSYLYSYIGIDGLFNIDKENIQLTQKAIDLTKEELERVGKKQRSPEYYKDVVSLISTLLRKSEGGQMSMVDIKKECMATIPELCGSSFYKIVDNFLPEQISKFDINGKSYLQIDFAKVEYIPSYSIDPTTHYDKTHEEPALIISKEERILPRIGERTMYDWERIKMAMLREFSYYKQGWWDLNISMEDGIDKFICFMRSYASNKRLSTYIPQAIYEFWNYKNDEMNYYRYMIDITTCYEKLLTDLYQANFGTIINTKGLMEAVNADYSISSWVNYSEQKRFVKSFYTLKGIRNKIAHGEDIDTGLFSMIQNTTSFIALYVYTIARFWKQ